MRSGKRGTSHYYVRDRFLRARNEKFSLACDMLDITGFVRSLFERLDSCGCRHYVQFNSPAVS
jgi:hypothetical protein